MSKWLENARAVAVPDVISAKTANKPSFGTNDTFGTPTEDRTKADALAAFEERAAICEYDGKLPRSHAELIAAACVAPEQCRPVRLDASQAGEGQGRPFHRDRIRTWVTEPQGPITEEQFKALPCCRKLLEGEA